MAGVYLPELKLQNGVPMTVHIWPNGKFHAVVDDVLTCMGTTVKVPPHGRLGDLDALIDVIERTDWFHQAPNKEMVHGANSAGHQAWYKEQDVYYAVESAPTIIPADREATP